MEARTAGRFGLGYNAAMWAESRQSAGEFKRFSGPEADAPMINSQLEVEDSA